MSGRRGPRPDHVWVDEPAAPAIPESLTAMRAMARALPTIRQQLGIRVNLCVHTSLAVERAAHGLGLTDVRAVACRTVVVSPSSRRMAEYGRTDGVTYVADLTPDVSGRSYDHHAAVVCNAGFADLTLDAHELVAQNPVLDWGDAAVTLDNSAGFLGEFAPDAAEGDAWAAGGVAPPGAFPGAGQAILAAWELIDRRLFLKNAEQQRVVMEMTRGFGFMAERALRAER